MNAQMKHQNNLSECIFINAIGVLATQIKLSDLIHFRLDPLAEPEVPMLQTALCDIHCCILP